MLAICYGKTLPVKKWVCDVHILAIATLFSFKKYYLDISFTNFIMNIFAFALIEPYVEHLYPFCCHFLVNFFSHLLIIIFSIFK